jgi:hypothetical protein
MFIHVERKLYLLIPRHYLELNTLAHGSTFYHDSFEHRWFCMPVIIVGMDRDQSPHH